MPEPAAQPTLLSAWAATLAAAPDAPALIEAPSGRTHSRAALAALATRFAAGLPGTIARRRVTFALPNGPGWFAAFLGLLHAGAVPVPLDPAEPPANQLRLAAAARASFAWIDGQLAPVPDAPTRAAGRHALVKLTSGSTGTPRALAFSHAQMLADGRQVCASMDIRPEDRNLVVIPFGHSYGLGNLVVPLLAQGTSLVCVDTPLPHALAAAISSHRATVFPAVPALLRVLAEADLAPDALVPLRTVISAGSPLPAATAQAFHARFGLKPHGFYGSSETGGIAYDRVGDDTLAAASVGTALEGVSIVQLHGQRVRVRSPAALRATGHIPADRARLEADGRLVLLGRAGRLHKIGGRRLDLGELEHALRALPDIVDAFVAPHPDDPEQLAAVLATPLDAAALRALLRARFAAWKIPRRLVPLPAFPLTARGKPDAAALRALLAR